MSQDWLGLFPEGCDLDWPTASGSRARAPPALDAGDEGHPGGRPVGDILTVDDVHLLLTADGATPLSDFAYAVYENLPKPHHPGDAARRPARRRARGGPVRRLALAGRPARRHPRRTVRRPAAGGGPPAPGRCPGRPTGADVEVTPSSSGVDPEEKSQAVAARQGRLRAVGRLGGRHPGHAVPHRRQGQVLHTGRYRARPRSSATATTSRRSSPTAGSSCSNRASRCPRGRRALRADPLPGVTC